MIQKYFIGYKGGGDIEKYYQAITKDLHEKFGIRNLSLRVPSHCTLKYPFELDDTSDIENRINEFLADRFPIEFLIEGFGTFDDNHKTIFLSPTHTDALDAFVEDFIISLGDLNEKEKFNPKGFRLHISVARHLTEETFLEVWNYLNTLSRPHFVLSFDNITLFILEDNVWRVKKTFLLKR